MSTVDSDTSSSVTAKFLQARITALSTTLIKRLENIFAAALEEEQTRSSRTRNRPTSTIQNSNNSDAAEPSQPPPSLTDTAVKQLQLDVESTALIRAAEELMTLTRSMKEIWLFGGLNTIPPDQGPQFGISADERKQMDEDERTVMRGIRAYLDKMGQIDNESGGVEDGGNNATVVNGNDG